MRFTFPERPGALLKFLSLMQPTWNISLFHYRNQGADYGRILVGMQVPPEDAATFDAFLATLGYPYVEETLNPAYRLFSRGWACRRGRWPGRQCRSRAGTRHHEGLAHWRLRGHGAGAGAAGQAQPSGAAGGPKQRQQAELDQQRQH